MLNVTLKLKPSISSILSLVALLSLITGANLTVNGEEKQQESVEMELPPKIYAVPGMEMNLYFRNIILSDKPEKYTFKAECAIGKSEADRWTVVPNTKDIGTFPLKIKVFNKNSTMLKEGTIQLIVSPDGMGNLKKLNLLVVGDSLTGHLIYPSELTSLLMEKNNPQLKMLGSRKAERKVSGKVVSFCHEGHPGWAWGTFIRRFVADADKDKKKGSPFLFATEQGTPEIDVARYFKEKCDGAKPDLVIFFLGVNDALSVNPADKKGMENRFKGIYSNAEKLIGAFRKALPELSMAICLTPPANDRDAAFVANYKKAEKRWTWRQTQFNLVKFMTAKFAGREKEKLFLIPLNLNIDSMAGYPENNGVHPNVFGYKQLATSTYCWIKWWLASPYSKK